jgi:cytochrome c oxidase subunit II
MFINTQSVFSKEYRSSSRRQIKSPKHLGCTLRVIGTALLTIGVCVSSAMPTSPRRIEITARRFAFEPAEVTVKKGETIDLVLTSADVPHGVRVRELGLDLRAGKGKSADETITPDKLGTFVGHCSVFCGSGHGQMTLTIHVVA